MEFRSPTVALQQNAKAMIYLTENLTDRDAGRAAVEQLIKELGNAIDYYPDWHPILTAPPRKDTDHIGSLSLSETYKGLDHTSEFVRGFVTCPYSDDGADKIVAATNQVPGLYAYRLNQPLYADSAHPVVVVANAVELEADGTIRSRDALTWFAQQAAAEASSAQVAETWWNIRSNLLGGPHGSRSSLFVNQHTGNHMRKILEAMNASGMFGPVRESSLDMLSHKKRDAISETLIRTALAEWEKENVNPSRSSCAEKHVRRRCAIHGVTIKSCRCGCRFANSICTSPASTIPRIARLRIPIPGGSANLRRSSCNENYRSGGGADGNICVWTSAIGLYGINPDVLLSPTKPPYSPNLNVGRPSRKSLGLMNGSNVSESCQSPHRNRHGQTPRRDTGQLRPVSSPVFIG